MKRYLRHTCFYVFTILLSCTQVDDFDIPRGNDNYFSPQATDKILPMSDFKAMAFSSAYKIADSFLVEAYVVSSDKTGNFFKTLSLVSADGKSGFVMNIDKESIYTFFDVGRQVFLKPKGLSIAKVDDEVEVGVAYNGGVGRIPALILDSFLFRGKEKKAENTLLQKAKISSLSPAQLNTLVEIDSIQFVAKSAGARYFEPTNASGSGTNHYIEDKDGNELLVRMSQYADFANATIPKGIGKIKGVLQRFGSDYQLIIRDTTDIAIAGASKIWGFSTTPIQGEIRTVRQLRDSFAAGVTTLTSPSYIEVSVTLSPNDAGNTGSSLNVYVQDTSAGILLRTTQPSRLVEGYKIKIDVQNAILSEYRGLLQLSNVYPQTKIEIIDAEADFPKARTITLQELNEGKYPSEWVSIEGVQFFETPSIFSGSNYIVDGTSSALVYTQPQANFSNTLVPQGRGTIYGVTSVFDEPQLLIRNTATLSPLTGARLDVKQQSSKKTIAQMRQLGSSLAVGAKTNISENVYIEGVVISQRETNNIQANNVIIQDETAGVLVRFLAVHDLNLGEKVRINVFGATMENYSALLQINNVKNNQLLSRSQGALPQAKKASIAELNQGMYQSEYIYIDSVQFAQSGTYIQNATNTTITAEKCDGQIDLFIRQDATFGGYTINPNNGKLYAIPTAFNVPQLYIRDTNDITLDGARLSCVVPVEELMISEVADPKTPSSGAARFIEIYNSGNSPVSTEGWKIRIYANGSTTGSTINLTTKTIAPGEFFILANNKDTLQNRYNRTDLVDQATGSVNMNGDDVIELVNAQGDAVDVFGEKGVDGTGTAWDYIDGRGKRKMSTLHPTTTFDINQWEVGKNNKEVPNDFDPRVR